MKIYQLPFYGIVYRTLMRVAHRFNVHYAPPIYPDGDTQLWCKWCGFRATISYAQTRYEAKLVMTECEQCDGLGACPLPDENHMPSGEWATCPECHGSGKERP